MTLQTKCGRVLNARGALKKKIRNVNAGPRGRRRLVPFCDSMLHAGREEEARTAPRRADEIRVVTST